MKILGSLLLFVAMVSPASADTSRLAIGLDIVFAQSVMIATRHSYSQPYLLCVRLGRMGSVIEKINGDLDDYKGKAKDQLKNITRKLEDKTYSLYAFCGETNIPTGKGGELSHGDDSSKLDALLHEMTIDLQKLGDVLVADK